MVYALTQVAQFMGRRGRSNLTEEHFFFVTTTVVHWAHIFVSDTYCDILIRNIKHYQQRYQFAILGYVIMPSHFHWIVEVNPKHGTISDIMRDIKKYAAWDLMDTLENDGRHDLLKLFEDSTRTFPNHQRKFWMSRFDDEVIRNQQMFWGKLNYIHNNPVEAGLVGRPEDYRYSSLATMSSEITRFSPLIRQWLRLRLRHEVVRDALKSNSRSACFGDRKNG